MRKGVSMKQWFKKAILCFSLALSVLMLGACGSSEVVNMPLEPSVKASLEQSVEQFATEIYTEDTEQLQARITSAQKSKDNVTYNGLTNYINSRDRLGAFQQILSVDATTVGEEYSVEVDAQFEKRVLELTLGLSESGEITEMTFNPHYTIGEELANAAGNLVVGMGTVFLVLIFIAWLISLFKYIPQLEEKFRKKKEAPNAAASAPVPAAAPAVAVAPAAAQAVSGAELQAVIAAAIAAYEADEGGAGNGFTAGPTLNNGLVIRSIRRR